MKHGMMLHGIVLCRGAWQGSGGIGLLTLFTLLQLQIDANEGSSSSDEDKRAPIAASHRVFTTHPRYKLGSYFSDMCHLFGGKKTRVEKTSQITHCSQERCNSLEPCFLLQRQISAEPQRVSGHGRGQDCLSSGNLITCL